MVRFGMGLLAAVLVTTHGTPAFAGHAATALTVIDQAQLVAATQRVARSPDSVDAQFELAMVYVRTPFLEHAWEALEHVMTLDPTYASKVVERYA